MREDTLEHGGPLLRRLDQDELRRLLDHAPEPTIIADRHGRIVFASLQIENVLGYRKQELLGEHVHRLLPERFRAAHGEHMERFFHAPSVRPMGPELELWALTGDGREIPVEISLSWIGDGAERLLVVSLRDVTARRSAMALVVQLNRDLYRKTAELEALVSDLRVFAQTASHDLQAPLRQITQFLHLLRRRCGDQVGEDGLDYIDCAIGSAKHLSELVADVLAYSRIGASEQTFEPVSVEAKLTRVLESLRIPIEESGATVTHDPLPVVHADAAQVEQLLLNLITNALRYRAADAPHIHASAYLEGDRWVLSVKDNGIGIDPAHHERIFEMFRRVGASTDRPGSGVGLAICKRVVERHHGRMWVTSEFGQGSTFFFTLPRSSESAAARDAA